MKSSNSVKATKSVKPVKALKKTVVDDIWDALEPSAAIAAHLRVRANILLLINKEIENRELPQKDIAMVLGISQPRVSDLQRGWIDRFSIDVLVDFAHKLGYRVELSIQPKYRFKE